MKMLLMSVLMLTSLSSNVSSQNKSGLINNTNVQHLFSSDFDKKYSCYEYERGYEIVDDSTGNVIEFSPDAPSPYRNLKSNVLIYDGPMSYDSKNNLTKDELYDKGKKAARSNVEVKHVLANFSYNYDTYIDNYQILSELSGFQRNDGTGKPYNKDGTCGYLCAAMILYYSKYQFNNGFVADSYIETYEGKKRFKAEFHDCLVNLGLEIGKKYSTDAFDIKSVMTEYCSRIGIKANHFAMLLSTVANINMCIQDNKPIALFGNFVSPADGKKVNHAVTCYGTRDEPLGQGQTNRYFIVNFGWTSYSHVYLLDNLFRNPVDSMYNMNY